MPALRPVANGYANGYRKSISQLQLGYTGCKSRNFLKIMEPNHNRTENLYYVYTAERNTIAFSYFCCTLACGVNKSQTDACIEVETEVHKQEETRTEENNERHKSGAVVSVSIYVH